jgi:hypothetical protein
MVQTDNGSEYSGLERKTKRDRGFTRAFLPIPLAGAAAAMCAPAFPIADLFSMKTSATCG